MAGNLMQAEVPEVRVQRENKAIVASSLIASYSLLLSTTFKVVMKSAFSVKKMPTMLELQRQNVKIL